MNVNRYVSLCISLFVLLLLYTEWHLSKEHTYICDLHNMSMRGFLVVAAITGKVCFVFPSSSGQKLYACARFEIQGHVASQLCAAASPLEPRDLQEAGGHEVSREGKVSSSKGCCAWWEPWVRFLRCIEASAQVEVSSWLAKHAASTRFFLFFLCESFGAAWSHSVTRPDWWSWRTAFVVGCKCP